MGYTRYYKNVKASPELAALAYRIILASDVSIRGWDGQGSPVITDTEISLNGDASKDEAYESFVINTSGAWSFCKTQYRPYDTVVSAILLAAKLLDPNADISDDDNGANDTAGVELLTKALDPAAFDVNSIFANSIQQHLINNPLPKIIDENELPVHFGQLLRPQGSELGRSYQS